MGRVVSYSNTDMKVFALLFLAAACLASPDPRQMTCDECGEEMHRMSFIVKLKAREIEQYLTANYCPPLPEDSHACDHDLPCTTSRCSTPWWSTTSWTGQSTSARPGESAMPAPEGSPARSVSRVWSGWGLT